MEETKEIYFNYIQENHIKKSGQREKILEIFLNIEEHISAQELNDLVRKEDPSIGLATVYRAMKVITSAGLAEELELEDGTKRYEHKYKHEHHDHLICESCGKLIEFNSAEIEKIQLEVCKKAGFLMNRHKMQIYGLCKDCAKNK